MTMMKAVIKVTIKVITTDITIITMRVAVMAAWRWPSS